MKSKTRRLGIAALTVLIAALGLLGCGDDPADGSWNVEVDESISDLTVDEGETVRVGATVQGVGEPQEETVTFSVGDYTDESEEQIGSDSKTVIFEWDTEQGDAGSHIAEVEIPNQGVSDVAEVEVEATEAHYEVEILEDQSELEVDSGEDIVLASGVENTGSATGSQELQFQVGALMGVVQQQDGSTEFELGPGQGEQIMVPIPTGGGDEAVDPGEHTITLSSDDDEDTATVTVN